MKTSPVTAYLGKYALYLNRSRDVTIWCDMHQVWIHAAFATRHFTDSRLHMQPVRKRGAK